jgi:ABC-type phosphate transport system substrate-binding protein
MIKTQRHYIRVFWATFIIAGILHLGFIPQAEAGNVVVIVNQAKEETELTLKDLLKIYKGDKKSWKNGGTIHLNLPPSGSPPMEALLKNVFHYTSEEELSKLYLLEVFQQNITTVPPYSVSDNESIQKVSQDPYGIALVDESNIPEGADVVKKIIDGLNKE